MADPAYTRSDWARRLAFSFLLGAGAVIAGTVFFVAFASDTPSGAGLMATYIAAIPLLPGIGFVDMLFGGWPSIHQGQIALIPVVSAPADIAIIFAIWTLVDRRNSPAAEKDVALRLRH